jgi:hypothetical protein
LLITGILELRDQTTIVDLTLPYTHLQFVFFRIPKMNVKDVLEQLLVVLILAGTAKVMTGVERQPNARNVVAKILDRIGIFAQATDLTLQADANTSRIPNLSQLLKMFNFLVERATMLSAGDRQRYDFGSFRKIANFSNRS